MLTSPQISGNNLHHHLILESFGVPHDEAFQFLETETTMRLATGCLADLIDWFVAVPHVLTLGRFRFATNMPRLLLLCRLPPPVSSEPRK